MTDRTEETLAKCELGTRQHSVYRPDHEWHRVCPGCRPELYAEQYARHKKRIWEDRKTTALQLVTNHGAHRREVSQ